MGFYKKYLLFLCFVPGLAISVQAQNKVNIVPRPVQLEVKDGTFTINVQTKIFADDGFKEVVALFLQQTGLENLTFDPAIVNGQAKNSIRFVKVAAAENLGKEGYRLVVTEDGILVQAEQAAGAFYASQSLAQLVMTSEKGDAIPCLSIIDKPRFAYRGLHLDVSRNFFPLKFIKRYIDLMALYKMNRFHWHLTDGAGWRLEIKQYPKLTQQAAWRLGKTWKEWRDNGKKLGNENDPQASGGYYTQNEAREIVKYAALRGITVIPEIEMPGHSAEVLAVYPELSCAGVPYENSDYCAGNPEVYVFLQNVLKEVMDIFPSEYIHIGGDEARKKGWKTCSKCQGLMKSEGYESVEGLQSYFIGKIEKFVNGKGRKIIGWDEILQGGLAPGATVMSWRGEKGGIAAAKMGHDVIMTPGTYCYFDHYQADPATEPQAIGGFVPIEKVYSYEPVPKELSDMEAKHVLGAQANVWAEYIPTTDHVEYMVYPRLLALSEVLWSSKSSKNWGDFHSRLQAQYILLDKMGVNYCPPSYQVKIKPVFYYDEGKALVKITSQQYKPAIYFTRDGSILDLKSERYTGPFEVKNPELISAAVFENGELMGKAVELPVDFHKAIGEKVIYNSPYSPRYVAQKGSTLVNGYRGSLTYQDGQWQGFVGADMDIVVDMGKKTKLNCLSINFMQLTGPGVYIPSKVTVSVSNDNKNFTTLQTIENDVPESENRLAFKNFVFQFQKQSARYIRVVATNKQGGFLFTDEVIVY